MSNCWFCGSKANILCDGHLGWLKGSDGKRIVIDSTDAEKCQFRCDRPLCRACVRKSYPMSMRTKNGCQMSALDYCADCVKESRDTYSDFSPGANLLLSAEDGMAIQKRRLFKIA